MLKWKPGVAVLMSVLLGIAGGVLAQDTPTPEPGLPGLLGNLLPTATPQPKAQDAIVEEVTEAIVPSATEAIIDDAESIWQTVTFSGVDINLPAGWLVWERASYEDDEAAAQALGDLRAGVEPGYDPTSVTPASIQGLAVQAVNPDVPQSVQVLVTPLAAFQMSLGLPSGSVTAGEIFAAMSQLELHELPVGETQAGYRVRDLSELKELWGIYPLAEQGIIAQVVISVHEPDWSNDLARWTELAASVRPEGQEPDAAAAALLMEYVTGLSDVISPQLTEEPAVTEEPRFPTAAPNLTATVEAATLNFNLTPVFGSATMTPNNPYLVFEVTAGGPIQSGDIVTNCTGYVTSAAAARVIVQGNPAAVEFYFEPYDGMTDTTMLVNTPDGQWYCNDDAYGLHPGMTLSMAQVSNLNGQYDIWIGTYSPRSDADGVLSVEGLG